MSTEPPTSPSVHENGRVADTAFWQAVSRIRDGAPIADEASTLLRELTEEEKLGLLDGDGEFWSGMAAMGKQYNATPIVMGEIARLGVPGFRFSDGPRGVVMGESTAFPVSMARGATWDLALEEEIGRAIGAEMRAQGGNFFGGVCINLPRHPAWGRAQETYGEDPYLLGEFGAALVRGVKRHGMAVAKHYALNSMENARFKVDVAADDATLHEVYLPHFRRVVEEGADGIMTSYNSVNGEWAGENETLLERILRAQWGFEGVTISDFIFGFRNSAKSVRAGLDVEAPMRQQRARDLPSDLNAGRLSWEHVERAARRVLTTQLRFFAGDRDAEPEPSVVFSADHRALSRRAAATSAVLLKNDLVGGLPVLPWNPHVTRSVAVVGRLSDIPNTGDKGSSNVHSPHVVSPLEGIRAAVPHATVVHVGDDDPVAAGLAASRADVAVVVVGYTAEDEGEYLGDSMLSTPGLRAVFPAFPPGMAMPSAEDRNDNLMGTAAGGDRVSLRLRSADVEMILAVAEANPRTVVAIVTAGAVIIEEWEPSVSAILVSWYAGSEGGHALADVIFGAVDASGRLPYSIPKTEDHLPFFDADAEAVTYDRWHGQRLLDRDGHQAAYPLGYGLSYTEFTIDDVVVGPLEGERFGVTVRVTNCGDRPGRHVVQIYGVVDAEDFPRRSLLGFAAIDLPPGEQRAIEVTASVRPMLRWTDSGWAPASSAAVIEAASYSGDPNAVSGALSLG
ncbi:glycoside hydrolase family 3 C-terminal domain-containing protein [Microbacterium sp. zg.Y625]|uniref:glycoside hydrolase family 3 protein n=1 Tax=Microbacterium jiangjiandongii TaxID=3049071 RepID=UPI00214C1BA9|nr:MULTISPECIES: glycoside hydrolase family 3 C-terminal domain-containing protein [unclassified Microbacterium]MCR2792747.1 glycoside hydrolase family 3 C-terminal domain-containing protein [Microbacterium sp. zg.Y625]WIM26725.1 glycoside hydrolase family 3 C-terminal domain-containing protein [Microbacterium sp. zg-Y625]